MLCHRYLFAFGKTRMQTHQIQISGGRDCVHQIRSALFAFTEVLDVAPSDRPDAGVVRFKHWGMTHDDRLVFEGERTVLVKRRSHWTGEGSRP